jgi:predicted lysophospholipase L1 biosynthesis ABC-type transport system permease subunit
MATMTAVWVLVRVRLRARWRALLGLAFLVGVASGVVMAAAVGGRRTDTAYSRYAPGTDAPAALFSLQQPSAGHEQDVLLPRAPTDVENLGRVGGLPGVLAGLLALLAASALAHLLLTSIRRRGHDLAILKTLGFVRRQVSATVAWQATTVAMVAVVIGVPLGVAVGRWTWSLLIDRIGLSAEPVAPGPTLLAGVLGAMLVANLVAVWPGRVAARARPVVALRSE